LIVTLKHIVAVTAVLALGVCRCPTVGAVEVTVSNEYGHCVLVHAGSASFLPKAFVSDAFDGAVAVRGGDIDGDGDNDLAGASKGQWSGSDGQLVWWENLGGGTGWTQRAIATGLDYPWDMRLADLDRDGDLDAVGAVYKADAVVWWENEGGGTNWTARTVDADFERVTAVIVADIDNDGHRDIVGVASYANEVAWWENRDGSGVNWTKRSVDSAFTDALGVAAGDVDGDGDVDIVSGSAHSDEVAWWENRDGSGTNWLRNTIDPLFRGVSTVHVCDMDNDGDRDVVGGASVTGGGHDHLVWWENRDGSAKNWNRHGIESAFPGVKGTEVWDVDRDGDMDLLAASNDRDDVAWWENRDSLGRSWRKHVLDYWFTDARSVGAGDLNGDGETDVFGCADSSGWVAWWENPITNRTVFLPPVDTHTLPTNLNCRLAITNTPFMIGETQFFCEGWTGTGDVPPSGTLPCIEISGLSNDTTVAWLWTRRYELMTGVISNGTIDVESGWYAEGEDITITATPGFLHVFRAWTGDVSVAESTNNPLVLSLDAPRAVTAVFAAVDNIVTATAGEHGTISPTGMVGVVDGGGADFTFEPEQHYHVDRVLVDGVPVATNVPGYSFANVVSSHIIHVTFDLNTYDFTVNSEHGETHLIFGPWMTFAEKPVDVPVDNPRDIHAVDLDSDGCRDLVGLAGSTNPVVWWRNEDGGTNWSRHAICTNATYVNTILPGDFDGDGEMELAAIVGVGDMSWFDNPTGGPDYASHAISTNEQALTDFTAFDADGDLMLDILAVSEERDRIVWWRNEAGTNGWTEHVISTNFWRPGAIAAGDIDGDGHTDFAVASAYANEIAWWRNVRGDGSLWDKTRVGELIGVGAVVIADMDTDGDMDILSATAAGRGNIVWWENIDLLGTSWRGIMVESYIPQSASLGAVDLDRDADMDVIAADPLTHSARWWENTARDGQSWTPRFMDNTIYVISSMAVADFDNDGELDAGAASPGVSKLSWLKNQTTDRVVLTPPSSTVTYPYATEIQGFHTDPVRRNGREQTVLTGWHGSGSVPSNGTESSFGPFALEAGSALDWYWTRQYWVQIAATTNGTVSPRAGWFPGGTNLAIVAEGDAGHAFAGWSGDVPAARRLEEPLYLLIDTPKEIAAQFVQGDCAVIAEAYGDGTITPSGTFGVWYGTNLAFAMVPDPQHAVSDLVVDGNGIAPRESYTFYSITGSHEIVVTFVEETAETDTDGDNLPNVDEGRFGLDKYDADTDDDGFGDYAEAVTGTDGTDAQSMFRAGVDPPNTNGAFVMSWQSVTGRVYSVWSLRDLAGGTWSPVEGRTNMPGTGAVMAYTNSLPDAARCFRPGVRFAQ